MDRMIELAIRRPVAVFALIFATVIFGIFAFQTIPIQMSPDIEKPRLDIRVRWAGASPIDVDREVVGRLEAELSSLNGVEEIASRSSRGYARINLTYSVGKNMDKALVLLLNKLSSVSGLPADASTPTVRTANSEDSPIARLALVAKEGVDINLEEYGGYVESNIVAPLTRVKGVSEVNFRGGGKKEIRILVDPQKLIKFKLSLTEVIQALKTSSSMLSVGEVTEGKRSYVVRTESVNYTPDTAKKIVIRSKISPNGTIVPILLDDLATVEMRVKKRTSFRRMNGKPAVTFSVLREQGSNVVATMTRLSSVVTSLNKNELANKGLSLSIVYDETNYISAAIQLVKNNIFIGGFLAFLILILFFRHLLPTLIVFGAIPVSVIGTFVAIAGLGLSINVISLAGLAFAVGMVVDASIVSLENIFRLRQKGIDAPNAAYHGARQVWAPILSSALTTVVVFVPVLLLDLPVGQLFKDIGIAISVAVLISVIVSVTVIPTVSARVLSGEKNRFSKLPKLPLIDSAAYSIKSGVVFYSRFVVRKKLLGTVIVIVLTICSISAILKFVPKLDYLPDGNANFMFGRISVPAGYSMQETLRIAERMEEAARPLWSDDKVEGPAISRFFFVAYSSGAFAGASAVDASRVRELRNVLMKPIFNEPGARAFVQQASLFGRSVGGSRVIRVDIVGPELDIILPIANRTNEALRKKYSRKDGNQIRALPGLDSGAPQIRISPDINALSRIGLTVRDFATALRVFNDGLALHEVPINGELIDLVLAGRVASKLTTKQLRDIPIIASNGKILRVGQLATIEIVDSPVQIRRLDGKQAVSIQLRPIESLSIETLVDTIDSEVLPEIRKDAAEMGVTINLKGAASALEETWEGLKWNLLTAVFVIFLVLVIMLRNFFLPIIIMLAIPVSIAGGVGGLALLNLFKLQPLDMLTMLGFVILIGVVVNNSILMIEQTILHIKEEHLSPEEAIVEATKNRIRPIFLSTLTSLFGLVPLVIFPGAGSELYRGIGVVVFGGLTLSTVATLIMVPPMLGLFLKSSLTYRLDKSLQLMEKFSDI